MILDPPITYIEAFRSYHISNEFAYEYLKSKGKTKKEHRNYENLITPLLCLEDNVLNGFKESPQRDKILEQIHELEASLIDLAKLQEVVETRGPNLKSKGVV